MILHCKVIVGTNWTNEMNFAMNHAPGAGSIARLGTLGHEQIDCLWEAL